jgi:cobalt-zinc-cadmium efflux system membrane fusion protein
MPRDKTLSATAAAMVIAIGSLAFWMNQPTTLFAGNALANTSVTPSSGTPAANGGVLLTQGQVSLELVSAMKNGMLGLTIYPAANGKPLDLSGVDLSGTITHYDGSKQTLQFARAARQFTLVRAIAEPLVFELTLDLRTRDGVISFLYARTDGAVTLSAQQIAASRIAMARAAPGVVSQTFQVPGEIRLNEDRTAHIVPRVAGIVEQVPVSLGEHVNKGQLLAVLASAELSGLRSDALGAERRLSAARVTYAREKRLWEEQISAQQDYQQADTQLREAMIAADNARAKLRALNTTVASGSLNRYELRAPFEGTVSEKHLAVGEAVAADAKVLLLTDLSSVWAQLALPAQRLDTVRVGQMATVRATGFDSQARGRIAYIGALLGEQTRTAPARVVVPNPEGRWRPGLFVQVVVETAAKPGAITVAADALQDLNGRSTVFVRTPGGFVAKPVKVGRSDERNVEIVAGLNAGETYASSNTFLLKAELGKNSAAED